MLARTSVRATALGSRSASGDRRVHELVANTAIAGIAQGSQGKRGRQKVPRPSYEQLLADLAAMSWVAVGTKYGVSDNAVRKWLRRYEAERSERAA